MSITVDYANKILGYMLGGKNTGTNITNYYLGLSTTKINKDGTGITEPTIGRGGYQRAIIANSQAPSGSFSVPSDGSNSNAKEIVFPTFTEGLEVNGDSESEIRVTHWFLSDDANAKETTNIKFYGELTYSRPLIVNSTLSFGVGEFVTTIVTEEV